jgi:hypothetical protein
MVASIECGPSPVAFPLFEAYHARRKEEVAQRNIALAAHGPIFFDYWL